MASNPDSKPEDEYADDEYADYDAEDREQPSTPTEIPDDEPEDDVLEQRQEVPYGDYERYRATGTQSVSPRQQGAGSSPAGAAAQPVIARWRARARGVGC